MIVIEVPSFHLTYPYRIYHLTCPYQTYHHQIYLRQTNKYKEKEKQAGKGR